MKIRLAADLQMDSIVDGEGIRTVIWTQGCPHHCKGCHNPETWAYDQGIEVDVEEVKKELSQLEGQDGITLSGGDPLEQVDACIEICKHAKKLGMNVWCYTGYLYEEVQNDPEKKKILPYIDVLVDGPFILEERSLDLYFKGSRNQRVIDVPESLKEQKVCLVSKYAKAKDVFSRYQKEKGIFV